jgi:hypothetical protein
VLRARIFVGHNVSSAHMSLDAGFMVKRLISGEESVVACAMNGYLSERRTKERRVNNQGSKYMLIRTF